MKLIKYHYNASMIENLFWMIKLIRWLIFIEIVIIKKLR